MPIKGKKPSKQRAIRSPQTSGRTVRGALTALVTPSPELAHIVGSKPLSRSAAIRTLWGSIRGHDLQDPRDRRMIRADDRLSMFEMTACVSKHLLK